MFYSEYQEIGSYYPDKIVYTFNEVSDKLPADDEGKIKAFRTVKFEWKDREDVRTSYSEGAKVTMHKRLEEIRVYIGTTLENLDGFDENLLHKYKIEYEMKNGTVAVK